MYSGDLILTFSPFNGSIMSRPFVWAGVGWGGMGGLRVGSGGEEERPRGEGERTVEEKEEVMMGQTHVARRNCE